MKILLQNTFQSKIFILVPVLLCLATFQCGLHIREFPKVTPVQRLNASLMDKFKAQEYFIKARDFERRGMVEMSMHFYKLAYGLDPESKTLRNLLIQRYMENGKYDDALNCLKQNNKISQLPDEDRRLASAIYIYMQDIPNAIAVLEQITKQEPQDLQSLAFLNERIGDITQAVAYFRLYYQLDMHDFQTAAKIADLLVQANALSQAESCLVSMDTLYPKNRVQIYNYLAAVKIQTKDTTYALQLYNKALSIDTASYETLTNLGQLYINQQKYSLAIQIYEKLSNREDIAKSQNKKMLGLLYYYNKQYESAKSLFIQLLTDDIDNPQLHLYLGMVFHAEQNYEHAELEYLKSLDIKEDFDQAWIQLCYVSLKQEEIDKALKYALLFKEKMPNTSSSWRLYGFILSRKKEYKRSLEALKKASSLDPKDFTIWFEIASVYERLGNYRKSEEAFHVVLSINPTDAGAANYLGYMWADQNKNLDSAKALIRIALNQEPDNGAYLDSYAWVLYKAGAFDSAYVYIQRAIQSIDDDPVVFEHLGDISTSLHKCFEAKTAYQKCLELKPENAKVIKQRLDGLGTCLEE